MNPRTVELSPLVAFLFVLTLVATFGVATLVLGWLVWYRYPHVLDQEGVTTRSGKRYLWADVREVLTLRRRSSTGLRISFEGGGVIHVVPNMILEADQVLAYIQALGIRSESWR